MQRSSNYFLVNLAVSTSMRLSAYGSTAALLFVVVCLFTSSVDGAEIDASPPPTTAAPSDIELAKLYDAVVETIEGKFYSTQVLQQLDWSTRAKALRPSVLASPTKEDAVRQINALLSELKTSHTGLFTPDDYDYYVLLDIVGAGPQGSDLLARHFWGNGPYYPGIGVFTREIEQRHFIDGILEGSPADKAGLKYGDEILSVDGEPYSAIAAFRGKLGTTADIAIRRHSNDEPRHLRIDVIPIRPSIAFSDATKASAHIIERNGRRLGYIHIWASHEANSFKAALANFGVPASIPWLASTAQGPIDGLIVDMRGRVGGNIAVAGAFLEAMDPDAKNYFGEWQTFPRNLSDPRIAVRSSLNNGEYRGRSALLINQHTRSAAEIMAFGFQRRSFGPVVGTQSAGAVMSGSLFVMPGDMLLYAAEIAHRFDTRPLEGIGITPDYRVEQPLPYADGADPVLDTAADLLAKRDLK
jgi:carboxyl-terminal processing protease